MVPLYVFNPAHKLRLFSRLLCRGSKRLLRGINISSTVSARSNLPLPCMQDVNNSIVTSEEVDIVHNAGQGRDVYGLGEYCIFQVESTLFKVHRNVLSKEPSAFGDMFSLPNTSHEIDQGPVPLSDTVEQFRDLLWVLNALPTELCIGLENYVAPSLDRLLNIAEMTNKYGFSSYEIWAIENIYLLAKNPTGFLRNSSPEVCARVLNVAVLCNSQKLLDRVTHCLTARILWFNMRPGPVLAIAEMYGLHKIMGVAYYRELIDLERVSYDGVMATQLVFPSSLDLERRMRFLAAHHSLVSLWEQLRVTPPSFQADGCAYHIQCIVAWQNIWLDAGNADQTLRCGSADVLGRLKSMMMNLRKTLMENPSMSVQCTLAALEAISSAREDIIDGLLDHFIAF